MKTIVTTTFCILMLCSLILSVAIVMAAEPGYIRYSRPTLVTPTLDGMWTSDDEWTDGEATWIGTDVFFTSTRDGSMTRWIIEFLTDTTNDSEDYWLFCFDGDQVADSANWRFDIFGHTELVWSIKGTGDWTEGDMDLNFEWAESLSASPTSSTPHWILEFQVDKSSSQIPFNSVWNFYLEVYDASNPAFHAWPPTSVEYADEWGIEDYNPEPIPEGLTFAVMALLTTVSMLVGYRYFVKRKETKTQ